MLSSEHGNFDYVIAMDSLIHYGVKDIIVALGQLAKNTNNSILFTVAPKTFLLSSLLVFGKLFPQSDRSPRIAPVSCHTLNKHLQKNSIFSQREAKTLRRIESSFYMSEALILKL